MKVCMRCFRNVFQKILCGINQCMTVAVFNYGRQASLDIYKMLNVKPGQYTSIQLHVIQ